MSIILAISGGSIQSTHPLNIKAIELTKKEHPNVLFIGTATHDEEQYIEYMRHYYEEMGCFYDSLNVSSEVLEYSTIASKFDWADLIYVGGGDTGYMLDTWKQYGVDQAFEKAFHEDKVFTGVSAGSGMWFHTCYDDTEFFKNPDNWDYIFIDCLDYFPFTINPHYNEEGRNSFDWRVYEQSYSGFAMDNDTALLIEGNHIQAISAYDSAHVYFVDAWKNYEKTEFKEMYF